MSPKKHRNQARLYQADKPPGATESQPKRMQRQTVLNHGHNKQRMRPRKTKYFRAFRARYPATLGRKNHTCSIGDRQITLIEAREFVRRIDWGECWLD